MASFLRLHSAYQAATDQLLALTQGEAPQIVTAPEAVVHNEFRRHRNHFRELEEAAETFWAGTPVEADEVYVALEQRLRDHVDVTVRLVRVKDLPGTLRQYDASRREIRLSEALDHTNRIFGDLVHMCALLEQRTLLDALVVRSGITDPRGVARLRVELANYFAAAVLMPYDAFLAEARATKYDLDHIATRFGVSFEQACHRAATPLSARARRACPSSSCGSTRAETSPSGSTPPGSTWPSMAAPARGSMCTPAFRARGGSCRNSWKCRSKSQFFVFSRTVDRPTWARHAQDNRLAVAMGCAIEHASEIGYAEVFP